MVHTTLHTCPEHTLNPAYSSLQCAIYTQPANTPSSVHLYNDSYIQNLAHVRIDLPPPPPQHTHTTYMHTCVCVHKMPFTFTVGTQPCILPQLNLPALTIPGGPTPRPQAPGMLFWKLGGVPRQAGLQGASWTLEASCVSSGSCLCRAGQPTWPRWLLSLGGRVWARRRGAGAVPCSTSSWLGSRAHLNDWVLSAPRLGGPALASTGFSPGGGLHTAGTTVSTFALSSAHGYTPSLPSYLRSSRSGEESPD